MSFLRDKDKDVIAALATPQGRGGIAVIRISGAGSLEIARGLCGFLPSTPESHKVYYGLLKDALGVAVDEVLVTYFQSRRSFTGEETVEISCHGNPVIAKNILEQLSALGARPADRGEFTYRAFMNGRIDLVQAESVLTLIESETQKGAQQALVQLQGGLSDRMQEIEGHITWCVAHLEAGIDFSTEGLELAELSKVQERLEFVQKTMGQYLLSFQGGRLLKDGYKVALVGRPNVGKSSLLNALLEEDRAIVSELAGTTRDVVEGELVLEGIKIKLQDTAGIRNTEDHVESIGIERAKKTLSKADAVVLILDGSAGVTAEDLDLIRSCETLAATKIVAVNKRDLINDEGWSKLKLKIQELGIPFCVISGSCLDNSLASSLKTEVSKEIKKTELSGGAVLSQARHFDLLKRAHAHVSSALNIHKDESAPELAAFELKEAVLLIFEIQGKVFDDQIMDRVFKEFCIGK